MKYLIFVSLFLFFCCFSFAQKADKVVAYTLGDTVLARQLIRGALDCVARARYKDVAPKTDSAYAIFSSLFGSDSKEAADAIHIKGYGVLNLGKTNEAIDLYNQSLKIRLKIFGEKNLATAISYGDLGVAYVRMGKYAQAMSYYNKALEIKINLQGEEHVEVARLLGNIANCFTYLGQYDKAQISYHKCIKIIHSNLGPDHPDLGSIYYNLGTCYTYTQEYDKSIDFIQKALDVLIPKIGEKHPYVALAYDNIGLNLNESGELDKALAMYEKAMYVRISILGAEHPDVAHSLYNIGTIYLKKKNFDKALQFYEKTLNLRLKSLGEDHPYTAYTYNNIGLVYATLKKFRESIYNLKKALEIRLKILDENHPDVAQSYTHIGSTYAEMKKTDSAFYYFKEALRVRLVSPQNNYSYMGPLYAYMAGTTGDSKMWNESDSLFHTSLKYFKYNNHNLDSVNQIEQLVLSLDKIAQLHHARYADSKDITDLYSAHDYALQALAAAEYQRNSITSEGSKAQLADNHYAVYEGALETSLLVADLNHNDSLRRATFDYPERSKAALLRSKIKESEALGFARIPDSLLQQEYDLRIDIAWRERQRQEKTNSGLIETDSTVLALSSKIFDLRQQYDTLKTRFEKNYPDYYRLKYDLRTVPLQYVQDSLLQPGQSLLEYFVGDSSIYLFLVQPKNYEVIEIKKDTAFNQWIEDLTRNGIYGYYGKKGVSKGKSIANYGTSAYQLYETLIAPIKAKLPKDEKLIIIPDGILGYVPFEALLTEKPPRPDAISAYQYLIQDHQISYCYSATLLKEMRNKKHRQEPTQKLLAMAPFFLGNADTLLSKVDSSELLADVVLRTRDTLTALPSSGPEVASINKILKGQAFYGKEATLQKFQELASRSRILHLSTHGKADDRLGDYAYLAFGMPTAQGIFDKLYARDLYNLSLNADLVVLSACETGIGKLQRGEGIVSLARAFAYAGAKSIVTTLWKVSDEQSKNLMSSFYKYLSKGKAKDEALRLAKLDFLKANEKRTELLHPFFWASFIGIGDMGKIQ